MPQAKTARRAPAAFLAAAALATALTGCADVRVARQVVDDAADPADSLSNSELQDLVLAGNDVPGGLTGPAEAPGAAAVDARDEDCDPLARLLSAGVGGAGVEAYTAASWAAPGSSARTTVVIASFVEKDGAQRVVDEGLRALDWCYTFARPTTASTATPVSDGGWTEHQPQCVPVPGAGDLSVGLLLGSSADPADPAESAAPAPTGYVIVRVDDVLAVFGQADPAAGSAGMPHPDIVSAQVERIREAVR